MDRDMLGKEILKLQKKLENLEPETEAYSIVKNYLASQWKLAQDFDEACDKQNERQSRLDYENLRLKQDYELKMREYEIRMKELEIREKEIESKNQLEKDKIMEAAMEADERRKAEKKAAIWELVKIGFQGVCIGTLIRVTGRTEESVIIGGHKWSLIPKFK